LFGKVVLIDFLTYSCINCLDAIPYVKNWHKKYKGHGLVVLKIQALEFCIKKYQNVLQAVKKLDKISGSSG
jgi:thiol-disulfide isomerase/thioredoxin